MPAGALSAEVLPTMGVPVPAVRVATAGDGLVAAAPLAFGRLQGRRLATWRPSEVKVRQVFPRPLSKIQGLGALIAIATLSTHLEVNPTAWWTAIVNLLELVLAATVPRPGGIVPDVSTLVHALGMTLPVYYAMNLTGQVSSQRDALMLDLNGLYPNSPSGPLNGSWRNGPAVAPGRARRLRVGLEGGGVLWLRVPEADRDRLGDVLRPWLRQHHQDLYGICPDPESGL